MSGCGAPVPASVRQTGNASSRAWCTGGGMRSFWHLEKGDFFDGIEEGKEHFLRSAQRIELKKNDIVFFEGDAGGACFYVASGLLRHLLRDRGRKGIHFFPAHRGRDLRPVGGPAGPAPQGQCPGPGRFRHLPAGQAGVRRSAVPQLRPGTAGHHRHGQPSALSGRQPQRPDPAMSATGSAVCCSRWRTRACATRPPGNSRWPCR